MSKMRIVVTGDNRDQVDIMLGSVYERVSEYGFRGQRVERALRTLPRDLGVGWTGEVECTIEDQPKVNDRANFLREVETDMAAGMDVQNEGEAAMLTKVCAYLAGRADREERRG